MRPIVGGVLALMLAIPASRAQDKPKDPPASPAERYKALLKEYQDAMKGFQEAVQAAKSPEEQQKVFREKYPSGKFAPRFLELAEQHANDPVALDALVWIVTNDGGRGSGTKDTTRPRALTLLREHVGHEKLGRVVPMLGFSFDKESGDLLRAILEKHPNEEVKGQACLALAQGMRQRAELAKRIKDDAGLAKRVEEVLGKDFAKELRKADLAKFEAEGEALFKQLADKYVLGMKPEAVVNLCISLGRSSDKGSEAVLRALLAKGSGADVQGPACLALAQVLKARADEMPAGGKETAAVRKESETLFERAAEKYADVKMGFYGTVGKKAKAELHELRFLAVGNPAPEVEGPDQDGKTFKLSDYKGKVVLLDFWNEF